MSAAADGAAADGGTAEMSKVSPDFLKRLLSTFKLEAEEHIRAMSSGLLELEKAPASEKQREIVETVFREAHSLKGAARAVNLLETEKLCQSLETVFAALKRGEIALSPPLFDRLHKTLDALGKLAAADSETAREQQRRAAEAVEGLESALTSRVLTQPPAERAGEPPAGDVPDSGAPAPEWEKGQRSGEETAPLAETVRISSAKLDALLLEAEELLSAKLAAAQRVAELREIDAALDRWEKERAKVRPDLRMAREFIQQGGGSGMAPAMEKARAPLLRLLGFLESDEGNIQPIRSKMAKLEKLAEQDQRTLGRMLEDLLEDMKKTLMLPFSSLLEIFPRLVRDLSRDSGKEAELVIHGGEIEADRRILEQMKDPLVHLVRNSIDHGIESPEERSRHRKPPCGAITISISPKGGGKIDILVSDDGRGIDVEKVRRKALKSGMVSQEEPLDEQAAVSLIFRSGFSTSPLVTEISGRGLGLAIAREKVEKLGGVLSCESRAGIGTSFRITLPLTLAAFRGVLVRQDEQLFVVPASHVERVVRVRKDEITTAENRETIRVDGQPVSLVRLAQVLQLAPKSAPAEPAAALPVVLLSAAQQRIGFAVDQVLHEQEVLAKLLGGPSSRIRNISGVTVLGTGRVVPILHVADLMESAVAAPTAPPPKAAAAEPARREGKPILVADDSITARTLVKNILESAGYTVKSAVDGMDAWTVLRSEEFDLLVSDVDMPRMNGFDLTARIRADKKLAELPVVLVTALESREDRERGIDVGANAYIVKKSFDQSNLLEVIRRLL